MFSLFPNSFDGHPLPYTKFFQLVVISFLINVLFIVVIIICDKTKVVDRSTWDYLGPQRSQSMNDAGCEYSSDERTNFLAQPVTALSNFTFSFAGLIILHLGYYDWKNMDNPSTKTHSQLIATHPLLSVILAGALVMMCATSFMWHASLSSKGANIDFGTMYILIIYLNTLCILRLLSYWNWKNKIALAIAVHIVSFTGLIYSFVLYEIQVSEREEVKKVWGVSKVMCGS